MIEKFSIACALALIDWRIAAAFAVGLVLGYLLGKIGRGRGWLNLRKTNNNR